VLRATTIVQLALIDVSAATRTCSVGIRSSIIIIIVIIATIVIVIIIIITIVVVVVIIIIIFDTVGITTDSAIVTV
jgi:hypothetical protein